MTPNLLGLRDSFLLLRVLADLTFKAIRSSSISYHTVIPAALQSEVQRLRSSYKFNSSVSSKRVTWISHLL